MNKYFVDLHVHIGRSSGGKEIKKATANNLTFENIAYESYRKGIDVIGVVDCISPYILEDINSLVSRGELVEKSKGGMEYRGRQNLILGAEIETHEKHGCSSHSLCFFPTLKHITDFSDEMSKHIKNIRSFSLMSRLTGQELFDIVDEFGGVYIPAHAFTPHKSFYGNCCKSLHEIFDDRSFGRIPAVELGLSADSMMASQLSELDGKTFISNSDAHSLPKMGREYNIFEMEDASYTEVLKSIWNKDGRRIVANYGLNPKLGKYHRSYCEICDRVIEGEPPVLKCPVSDKHRVVVGVRDRLEVIKDRDEPDMTGRPTYNYQIPLEFLPKVGPKTIEKLIDHFGSEMKVVHEASFEELAKVVKEDMARNIVLAREGKLDIGVGGGGVYGRIEA
ncbi:endonuclease Q family protein [Lutispora sp.]|uniref:endonuclease Q family protein n=1 Tax=Lutispora sp. TaxID=2828727 RepID=UPI002B213F3F|nr:endonuclease Q family protein [Lutispora sp.]MEA4961464.1 endonuclease Q family protein [Lutispora sp.]